MVKAVDLVRENELPFAVRSGGHSFAGHSTSDGGVIIDLSHMNGIEVDAPARRVRMGPGARWRAVDAATQAHGLATTGGTVSEVGVAGYILGGGTGYLARKHGLACDHLVSAEVVTASGDVLRASEDENPDLFWGLRGGGANLGIVTSFESRLHEVGPTVLGGQIVHPFDDAAGVLRAYRKVMETAPAELTCYAFLVRLPPLDAFPAEHQGKPAVSLVIGYVGDLDEGRRVVRDVEAIGQPIVSAIDEMPYTILQTMFDEAMPAGVRRYSRAHLMNDLSDAALDAAIDCGASLPTLFSSAYFEPWGAAVSRIDPAATAMPHRAAAFSFHVVAGWTDPAEDHRLIGWARSSHDALAPFSSGGGYVNLLSGDEDYPQRIAYGENLQRLQLLKKRWDPCNLFRSNHNVSPAP